MHFLHTLCPMGTMRSYGLLPLGHRYMHGAVVLFMCQTHGLYVAVSWCAFIVFNDVCVFNCSLRFGPLRHVRASLWFVVFWRRSRVVRWIQNCCTTIVVAVQLFLGVNDFCLCVLCSCNFIVLLSFLFLKQKYAYGGLALPSGDMMVKSSNWAGVRHW